MINISIYLAGYKTALEKRKGEKKTLVEIIKKASGIEVPDDSIVVGKNKVTINVSGSKKAVLFTKKDELHKQLTAYFASFTDIR